MKIIDKLSWPRVNIPGTLEVWSNAHFMQIHRVPFNDYEVSREAPPIYRPEMEGLSPCDWALVSITLPLQTNPFYLDPKQIPLRRYWAQFSHSKTLKYKQNSTTESTTFFRFLANGFRFFFLVSVISSLLEVCKISPNTQWQFILQGIHFTFLLLIKEIFLTNLKNGRITVFIWRTPHFTGVRETGSQSWINVLTMFQFKILVR